MKRLIYCATLLVSMSCLTSRPAVAQTDQFVGEIRIFGFNFCPQGWANANGQLLAITQNVALFSLLGTFYGGDGVQNFALPTWGPIFAQGGGGPLTTCIALTGIFPSRN
jgi:microcystin-dependent protein